MRPVAVLADIHGNVAALDRVLAEVDPLDPAAYLVLGDLFGELGEAPAVFERLADRDAICLMGNREADMASFHRGERPSWRGQIQFAPMTESVYDLGRRMDEVQRWPITRSWRGLQLAHGSPDRVRELLYPGTDRLGEVLSACPEDMLVVGHDHRQWYEERKEGRILAVGSLGLCHEYRAFRSQYALLWSEGERWHGKLYEVGYDGTQLAAQLKRSDWISRAGSVARAAYEESACGYEALHRLIDHGKNLCRREYKKVLDPLPNEIMEEAARTYPWRAPL